MSSIEERSRLELGGKRGLKEKKYLVFHLKNGGETELPLSTLLAAARARIEAGVQVQAGKEPPPAEVAQSLPEPAREAPSSPTPSRTPPRTTPRPTTPDPPPSHPATPSLAATDIKPDQVVTTQTSLAVGQQLETLWGRSWYPAEVIEVQPDGNVKIHYTGFAASSDEVVPRSRLRLASGTARPQQATPPIVASSPGSSPAASPPGDTPFKVGTRLEAQWGSRWYAASVVETLPDGRVKIHYEGWNASFDEAVPRDRLRIPAK